MALSRTLRRPPRQRSIEHLYGTDARTIAVLGVEPRHVRSIADWLGDDGALHLYDRSRTVEPVAAELRAADYCNVRPFSSEHNAAALLGELREPIYDYVSIDATHPWAGGELGWLLVGQAVRRGGYIDVSGVLDLRDDRYDEIHPGVWRKR